MAGNSELAKWTVEGLSELVQKKSSELADQMRYANALYYTPYDLSKDEKYRSGLEVSMMPIIEAMPSLVRNAEALMHANSSAGTDISESMEAYSNAKKSFAEMYLTNKTFQVTVDKYAKKDAILKKYIRDEFLC